MTYPVRAKNTSTFFPQPVSKRLARPNTAIQYPLYSEHKLPMPTGQLNLSGWKQLMKRYPDEEVTTAILGICKFGARIRYTGQRRNITIYRNLATALDNPQLVTIDIAEEERMNRLETYPNYTALPSEFIASPLGLVDKADGSKRRIHHLSFPSDSLRSINGGIPEEYGTIAYSTISEAITACRKFGKRAMLVKRDFESAFRHVPVSPLDSPLLGFEWQGTYYAERFLPFGLRTAPYLFNLFAEAFHWILKDHFERNETEAEVIHYLDDFLIVLPPDSNPDACSTTFRVLSTEVGLSIKETKNEQGTVVSFAGIELDSHSMVIRLPTKKLLKARFLVNQSMKCDSLSLRELQTLTGYLNFVALVVPLGRTFLRRLYNMEIFFPSHRSTYRKRTSGNARKDLSWWLTALKHHPERSIELEDREIVMVWSDAAATKGLGAFYIDKRVANCLGTSPSDCGNPCEQPYPKAAFSIPLPKFLRRKREHINTMEMRAVEQALLYWGRQWRGCRVVMNIDNRAVVHALQNGTIRGATMEVLWRCLLLATYHDLEIEARWIGTTENALADALSRFAYDKITNLAPQLLYPHSNLRDRGFLTSNRLDSPQLPPTTSGVA